MLTTSGTLVYVSQRGGGWVLLNGYAGGLNFGMSTSPVQLDGDRDGLPDYTKGNSAGSTSQIMFRLIEGDAGQELIADLCAHGSDGMGAVKAVRPQGGQVVANGIFLSIALTPFDPDAYQGYSASFMQTEPEIET